MTLDDIKKQITREFSDFMERILSIEVSLNKMKSSLESKIQKADEEIEFQNKESSILESQSKTLQSKIQEAEYHIRETKIKHDEAEDYINSCRDKESHIKKRQEQLSIQERSAKEQMQDANKRLAWAEMEERRLKFLQKKIDLVTQDESIKKKLKELE